MTQEAAETKPAATKATAKENAPAEGSHSATEVYQAPGGDPGHCKSEALGRRRVQVCKDQRRVPAAYSGHE